jgi:hypothetical protein
MAEDSLHDVTFSPAFLQLAKQRGASSDGTGAASSGGSGGGGAGHGQEDGMYAFKCA